MLGGAPIRNQLLLHHQFPVGTTGALTFETGIEAAFRPLKRGLVSRSWRVWPGTVRLRRPLTHRNGPMAVRSVRRSDPQCATWGACSGERALSRAFICPQAGTISWSKPSITVSTNPRSDVDIGVLLTAGAPALSSPMHVSRWTTARGASDPTAHTETKQFSRPEYFPLNPAFINANHL